MFSPSTPNKRIRLKQSSPLLKSATFLSSARVSEVLFALNDETIREVVKIPISLMVPNGIHP
jgi:hypothetical protein